LNQHTDNCACEKCERMNIMKFGINYKTKQKTGKCPHSCNFTLHNGEKISFNCILLNNHKEPCNFGITENILKNLVKNN
jgi:hypothetical protein